MVYELYISNSASSHPYPPTNSSHELSRRQNGARRDRIRAFEALLLGDTIVGLIHTIPTRGGTSRESSWAMSYTRGSTHLGYLGRIFISAPMTPKWPLLTPNSTKLSAVFTHGLCLTLSISTCQVRILNPPSAMCACQNRHQPALDQSPRPNPRTCSCQVKTRSIPIIFLIQVPSFT